MIDEGIRNRLIVALDVPGAGEALELVDRLVAEVRIFKVGLQLFTAEGPAVVRDILQRGGRVFLDLKLHDIPNTVAQAVRSASRLGVDFLTLHALGGPLMMKAAREAADAAGRDGGQAIPKLLAVTILTSLDAAQLRAVGVDRSIDDMVRTLALQAQTAGMDAVVCSPQDLAALKQAGITRLRFVTPGIRSAGEPGDDQVRTLTAAGAVQEGAAWLVVGRPVTRAADPAAAARRLLLEMQTAQSERRP